MFAALLLGVSYGFTAGVSPGPMLGLVITQTLQRGWRAGNIVALAPLITDTPIILLATLLISRLPLQALNWLSIAGGLFVVYLGSHTLRSVWSSRHGKQALVPIEPAHDPVVATNNTRTVLWQAIITNTLNPHPYLFWGTVGVQLLIRNFATGGIAGAAILLISFYAVLVGTKLLVALLVNHSRNWLYGQGYQRILLTSGVMLFGLGLLLIVEGIQGLG